MRIEFLGGPLDGAWYERATGLEPDLEIRWPAGIPWSTAGQEHIYRLFATHRGLRYVHLGLRRKRLGRVPAPVGGAR